MKNYENHLQLGNASCRDINHVGHRPPTTSDNPANKKSINFNLGDRHLII